jgi:hypothetical protein
MVLQGPPCGRVGRHRIYAPDTQVSGASLLVFHARIPAVVFSFQAVCSAAVRICVLIVPLALALSSAIGCQKESELAKMDEGEKRADSAPEGTTVSPPDTVQPTNDVEQPTGDVGQIGGGWPVDANGVPIPAKDGTAKLLTPGADEGRVLLRLALADGAHYRVTTIGMLKLPVVTKTTGFAREEDIELGDCKGEGAQRSCLLTHRYRGYEAEPPTGAGLEADEHQVAALVTSHRIDASGLRLTDTAVQGETSPSLTAQLTELHRLYCIRLPAEPVGLGATWRDVCRVREGGSLVTSELTWRLAKLEDAEDGRRAELEFAGRAQRLDLKGKLADGEVNGKLYLWVDAGEPHLMIEQFEFVIDASKRLSTGTHLSFQFAKLGEDGEQLIRTDGKPFEHPPQALNDPRQVPAGATRDAEHPAGGK